MKIPVLFLKAHVAAFTRKDGVTVAAHETSVQAAIEQPAHPRPIAAHAAAMQSYADKHKKEHGEDDDHATFSAAADQMKRGDHKSLASTVRLADSWKREKILSHVHPDHWEGLGAKPINKDRALKEYHTQFGTPDNGKKPAAAPARRPGGPGEGEIGDHEHQTYGVHFRPGEKAMDLDGNTHTVVEHRGASVRTLGGGSFHPTKLTPVAASAAAPAKPKAAAKPALDPHPNVIGKATDGDKHSFKFGGKQYHHTGKEGNSMHDQTPVREAQSEDGHRVWRDGSDRVHADSTEEARKVRGGK